VGEAGNVVNRLAKHLDRATKLQGAQARGAIDRDHSGRSRDDLVKISAVKKHNAFLDTEPLRALDGVPLPLVQARVPGMNLQHQAGAGVCMLSEGFHNQPYRIALTIK